MLENKRERPTVLLKVIFMVLSIAAVYFTIISKFFLSGILFMLVGVVGALRKFPFAVLLFLIGLTMTLFSFQKILLATIIASVMLIIGTIDAALLIKSLSISKLTSANYKSYLIENEITCKLLHKLKCKIYRNKNVFKT